MELAWRSRRLEPAPPSQRKSTRVKAPVAFPSPALKESKESERERENKGRFPDELPAGKRIRAKWPDGSGQHHWYRGRVIADDDGETFIVYETQYNVDGVMQRGRDHIAYKVTKAFANNQLTNHPWESDASDE